MTAQILQFLPRANTKADRAFWKGREKTERSRDTENGHAEPDTTTSDYVAPEWDPA